MKKSIFALSLSFLLLLCACGKDSQKGTSIDCISAYLEENRESMRMYELLNRDVEEFFSDYSGIGEQVVFYAPLGVGKIDSTCLTYDVYYWRDDSGSADAQQAAKELIRVMLESMDGEGCTFTVTDYLISEQMLLSWHDLPHALAETGVFADVQDVKATEVLLEKDREDYDMPFSWWEYSIAIDDDMWLLDPQFTFDYEGIANMYSREDVEAAGLVTEDGMVLELQQGSKSAFIHIIIKNGDIWRMQRAAAMECLLDS